MVRCFIAALFGAALIAQAHAASAPPPPPPGPPAGLPEAYDGYPTEALWRAYTGWVRDETHARRKAAYEGLALPGWSEDPAVWRVALEGPRYESVSYWIPHGNLFAFEQICPRGEAYEGPESCQWRYRSAFFDAQEADINAVVSDTFDGAAFAARLSEAGVGPDSLAWDFTSDFGQAGIVHARLDALIVTRDLRESECPGLAGAIARIAEVSVPLSPFGPPPPPAGEPGPPPPWPPGADEETLIFPIGFYPHSQAEMTISSRGGFGFKQLLGRLVAPVHACIEAQEEGE